MLRQLITPLAAAAVIAGTPAVVRAQQARASFAPKSPSTAVELSLLGTVVPTALGIALRNDGNRTLGGWLITYGVFLGPSTGYFYGGRVGRGFGGGALRFGILMGTAVGVMGACGGFFGCESPGTANAVALVGVVAYAISAIYDIANAGRAAVEWNARHEPRRLTVTPRIDPGTRSAGAAVRVTF